MNNSSVLFAVDLHKVLIMPDYKSMLALLSTHKYLFLSLFDPRVWYHIIKEGAIPEKIIDAIHKRYHTKGIHKDFLITILNCQHLNVPTVEVFQKLKAQGYEIYLASNIWPDLFQDLMQKFPTLKNLFNGCYIPSKENNYIEKPDHRYFENFKTYLATQAHRRKDIIFVDNSRANIRAAQHERFITILYKDTATLIKNLKQLDFTI